MEYVKRFWWTIPLALVLACGLSMCVTYNALVRHENGIEASTELEGGIFGGVKRLVSGESLVIALFTNNGSGRQRVAFAAPYPGKIIPMHLD